MTDPFPADGPPAHAARCSRGDLNPDVLPYRAKVLWLGALVGVNTAVYLWLNWHPVSPPRLLALTWIDLQTPFLMWTVWPYLALLLADVVLPFLVVDRSHFLTMLRAYGVATSANVATWVVFPTTYPRPPLPQDDSWTQGLYALLMSVDAPGNCLPSGHITIPFVACWAVSRQGSRWAAPAWVGCALLAPTILTLKQHYVWDLLAGFATACLGMAVATRWPARPTPT